MFLTFSLIFALFEGSKLIEAIGIISASVTALIFAVQRIAKTVHSIRENARLAEKERNDAVQEKIDLAVEAEKRRWLDSREDESERITRLKEIASEWREIATQKDMKIQLLSDELTKVHEELRELRNLYAESQRRIVALEEVVKQQGEFLNGEDN